MRVLSVPFLPVLIPVLHCPNVNIRVTVREKRVPAAIQTGSKPECFTRFVKLTVLALQ